MEERKACFGQCANMIIKYRAISKEHYVYLDPQKLPECETCTWLAACMLQRNKDMFKDILAILDNAGQDPRPRLK